MNQAVVTVVDPDFANLAQQTQAYEILAPEDKRERYFFFGGDVGDINAEPHARGVHKEPGCGGMRIDSQAIPRKTFYRCLVTPCVTTRKMELINLIPTGAMVAGSADRIKTGCGEYWINAGPEANSMIQHYGSPTDPTKNLGLIELAPDYLRGRDWEKEVKPLNLTKTFFPTWPDLPVLTKDVIAQLQDRLLDIETTNDLRIASNRDLYIAVGQDMLRALEAAQVWQVGICEKTNHAVAQPRGDEAYKYRFDPLDEICFKRSGMVKNTEALRKVAQQMADSTGNGLTGAQLQDILKTVVPAQTALSPEVLAAAIAQGVAAAMQAMQAQQQPAPKQPKTSAKKDGDSTE